MKKNLFRGFSTKNSRWCYGDLIQDPDNICYIRFHFPKPKLFIMEPVRPETVSQFIGIYDASFQPIFEGDILRHVSDDNNSCLTFKCDAIVAYDAEETGYVGYRSEKDLSEIGDPDTLWSMFYHDRHVEKQIYYLPNAIVVNNIFDIEEPQDFASSCLIVDTFKDFINQFQ